MIDDGLREEDQAIWMRLEPILSLARYQIGLVSKVTLLEIKLLSIAGPVPECGTGLFIGISHRNPLASHPANFILI